MEVDLCKNALMMAVETRGYPKDVLLHSDQGCQYTSGVYQGTLSEHTVVCSMSRRGQCWDNATAESFFGRLKDELLPFKPRKTKEQAIKAIEEYIKNYYNCQ
jgi:putative transposase